MGDSVQVVDSQGQITWDEIYMFGHRDVTKIEKFVKVVTSNHILKLTLDHYAIVVDNDQIFTRLAKFLQVGDVVQVIDGDKLVHEVILELDVVEDKGLFNPYTLGGTIVVDGVIVSVHSSSLLDGLFERLGINVPAGYQASFLPLRMVYRVLGSYLAKRTAFVTGSAALLVNSLIS